MRVCFYRLFMFVALPDLSCTAQKESVLGVILVRIFPAFSRIRTSVFSPNAGKCGKNAEQNCSEYGLLLRSHVSRFC